MTIVHVAKQLSHQFKSAWGSFERGGKGGLPPLTISLLVDRPSSYTDTRFHLVGLTSPTHIVRLVPDTPLRVIHPLIDLLPFTPHTLTSTLGILTLPTPVPRSVEEDWYSTNTPGLQCTVSNSAILLRSSHMHFGFCIFTWTTG